MEQTAEYQLITLYFQFFISRLYFQSNFQQDPGFSMLNIRRNQEIDCKSDRRDSSNASKGSSSNRFLKRKPDHKKIIQEMGSKKKRDTVLSEYFVAGTFPASHKQLPNFPEPNLESDRYILEKQQLSINTKTCNSIPPETLKTARSESNICVRKKSREVPTLSICKEMGSSSTPFERNNESPSVISSQWDFEPSPSVSAQLNNVYRHGMSSKKSKTQKFIQEELQNQELSSEAFKTEDIYELNQKQTDKTKNLKRAKAQYESMVKKNKWMHEQITMYKQKQHILKAEQQHLNKIIEEKDRVIDRLTREKNLLGQKLKNQPEQQLKETLLVLEKELRNEQQRIVYLKEENSFLESELLARNQEVTQLYHQYKNLQKRYKDYQKSMIEKTEFLKAEIQKQKQRFKDEVIEIDSYGQIQKWKQKVISQQQQLKYLRIQNQCLLMTKDELQKSDVQNRKLKDERDYFKKKVLENAKRTKLLIHQTSHSSSSVLLELSQCSIEK